MRRHVAGAGEGARLNASIDARKRTDKTQFLFTMNILSSEEERELDEDMHQTTVHAKLNGDASPETWGRAGPVLSRRHPRSPGRPARAAG